ncbi:MAG: hypothetical protein M0Z94_20765 [Dehalococcoidales bacterium]|nr:hypothetical protein [Dehalococcoidales bacterium]
MNEAVHEFPDRLRLVEACQVLKISYPTAIRRIRARKLAFIQPGGPRTPIFIAVSEINRVLRQKGGGR